MSCYTNPCKASGVGPSCWRLFEGGKIDFGRNPSDPPPVDDDPAGDNPNDPPPNIEDLLAQGCCDNCGDTGDSGDGGTPPDDTDPDEDRPPVDDGTNPGFTIQGPKGNPGEQDKKECIEDLEKKKEKDIQDCMCACFDDFSTQVGSNGFSGLGTHCWGVCVGKVEIDYRECFCTEIQCVVGKVPGPPSDGKPPPPDDDDDDNDNPGSNPSVRYREASLGPSINDVNFPSSTYERVIPLVYNRGVTIGNLIWASDARQVRKCVASLVTDPETGNITVTSTNVTQTYIDIAVAVCEGPVAGVSRIWIDGRLILNDDGDSAVVQNIGFFNAGTDSIDKYDQTLTEVRSYLGTEDQPSDTIMRSDIAYRGLCYVVFRNFEITAFGGTIPEIEIEVVRTASLINPTQVSQLVDGPLTGIKSSAMWVDRTDRRVYVGGSSSNPGLFGEGIRSIDYDTLNETTQFARGITDNTSDDIDHRTLAVRQGTLIAQTGAANDQRPFDVISTDINYKRSTSALVPNSAKDDGHGGAFVTLRQADGSYGEYFLSNGANSLSFLRIDPLVGTATRFFETRFQGISADHIVTLMRDTSVLTDQTFKVVRSNDFYAISLPTLSQNQLTILRGIAFATDTNQMFDQDTPLDEFIIPATVWGGATGGVKIAQVIADLRYQSLFIFLRFADGTGSCIRWSVQAEAVVWTTGLPSSIPFSAGGDRTSPESTTDYHWIGGDNVVYKLNKRTSVVTADDSDYGLPPIGGPQYYDVAGRSVTYVTQDEQIARLFIGRIFAGNTSLAEVFSDLFERAGYAPHEYDVSEIQSVSLAGYAIQTNVTLRSVLQQLGLIYDVTIRQRGTQIVVTQNIGDPIVALSMDNCATDASAQVFARTLSVDINEPRAVRVSYFDVDRLMAVNLQVVSNVRAPSASAGDITIDYPFASTATFAAVFGERVLYDATINSETMTVLAMPSLAALEPGDRLIVVIPDAQPQTFMVETISIGADRSLAIDLIRNDVESGLFVPGVTINPGLETRDGGGLEISSNVRPIPLLTNAAIPDDATPGFTSTSSLYVGIAYSGAQAMPPTAIDMQTATGASARVGVASEPLKWGIMVSPPSDVSSVYSTDRTSVMTVRFSRAGAEAFFVSELFNAFGTNLLLVNQELIQFKDWSVAPDGLTITFTNLLRGRHGTETYVQNHIAGEFVVLYTANSWVKGAVQVKNPEADNLSFAVNTGVSGSNERIFYPAALDHDFLKFFPPSNLRRVINNSGNISISANRRNRKPDPTDDLRNIIPEEIDGSAVTFYVLSGPFSENAFLEAVRGNNPGYIIRSAQAPFTYLLSNQVADQFDYTTDVMYIAVLERPVASNTSYAIPRGHIGYRAITPSQKW